MGLGHDDVRQNEFPVFERLKQSCRDDWQAYVRHDFVHQLARGTLPEECFRHYLIQDYLFLIHFARAYALAAYKADTLEDMRPAAASLWATVATEMKLHLEYCRGWGLSAADVEAAPEANATLAYTRYVLERGMAGDLLDLHVALSPCVLGYAEIGRTLLDDPDTCLEGTPTAAGSRNTAAMNTSVWRANHAAISTGWRATG